MTGREGQCSPRPAKVAYASAISSGLVLGTPSTKEATRSAPLPSESPPGDVSSMPISLARRYGLHRPVFISSWAKKVFTDSRVPVYMFLVPEVVELETSQGP